MTGGGAWPNRIWENPEAGLNDGFGLARDPFVDSVGMVTDGTRLYGVLYGATSSAALVNNAIFARWLQKKASFSNSFTSLTWTNADGPDKTVLLMVPGKSVETGTLTIYDTDGQTVLATSPPMTIRQGDQWTYKP